MKIVLALFTFLLALSPAQAQCCRHVRLRSPMVLVQPPLVVAPSPLLVEPMPTYIVALDGHRLKAIKEKVKARRHPAPKPPEVKPEPTKPVVKPAVKDYGFSVRLRSWFSGRRHRPFSPDSSPDSGPRDHPSLKPSVKPDKLPADKKPKLPAPKP